MKHLLAALLLMAAVGAASVASAAVSPTVFTPDTLKWMPASGPLAGTQVAVVYGNPEKPGPYILRVKIPDGLKVAPHFHSDDENVTVLSGTLRVGVGDTADETKMTELPAGSFGSIPKGLHHYAMAKGDTIIEISAMGPRTMTMLKPK